MVRMLCRWYCKKFGHDMYVSPMGSSELVHSPHGGFNCPRCNEWLPRTGDF